MSVIIVDAEQAATLERAEGSIHVRTQDGRFLEYFCRTDARPARLEPPISNEELSRRESEPGRPLADILRDLEQKG